jgi:hypothetical protein
MASSDFPISQLDLQGFLRNSWGRWDYKSIPNLQPVAASMEGYRPKWYSAPQQSLQAVGAGAYVEGTVSIKPGSWILGLSHLAVDESFNFQVTDLYLQHEWFSSPTSNRNFNSTFTYLPELYPVVGPGLFRVQFWNTRLSGNVLTAGRVNMIFVVAEPTGVVNE